MSQNPQPAAAATAAPAAPTQQSVASPPPEKLDEQFMAQLEAVLTQVARRFPENTKASAMVSRFGMLGGFKRDIRVGWRDMTAGSLDRIMARDTEHVCGLLRSHPFAQVRDLGLAPLRRRAPSRRRSPSPAPARERELARGPARPRSARTSSRASTPS
jgi:hypothetical protein